MEEIKTKGIVISAKDYLDSDKIVTIFSLDFGLIHARLRGVKKSGAKLAFACQLFALIEFILVKKNNFYSIINATSIDQFFDITADFDNYIFMLACLEVVQKTIKENDPDEDMFVLLLKTFKLVCYEHISPMIAFIKFMLEAMNLLGFKIELERCAICDKEVKNDFRFSFDYNGLICENCSNKLDYLELSKGEVAILTKINYATFDNLKNLKFLSRNDLVSVISLLCKIFRLQTDEEIVSIKKFL